MIRKTFMRLYFEFRRSVQTSFNGEFGYELISVIPFANWLQKQGKLSKTISTLDTKHLYFFSHNHEEIYDKRDYIIPKKFPIDNIHRRFLNTFLMWDPPDYKTEFRNNIFLYSKPICVICNKYNTEWGFEPITFLSIETLNKLFEILCENFQVVYCRPTSKDIKDDNSKIYDLKEHDWIRKNYPNVILIQDLHEKHTNLTFNQLQLMVFANANHFISTQGGYSILCSYFKGKNIIYGAKSKLKTALDITYKTYSRWYHRFSGSKIYYASNYDSLFSLVKNRFINSTDLAR